MFNQSKKKKNTLYIKKDIKKKNMYQKVIIEFDKLQISIIKSEISPFYLYLDNIEKKIYQINLPNYSLLPSIYHHYHKLDSLELSTPRINSTSHTSPTNQNRFKLFIIHSRVRWIDGSNPTTLLPYPSNFPWKKQKPLIPSPRVI